MSFENKELRNICEDKSAGENAYGELIAQGLRKRLADLDVAGTLQEIVVGMPGVLSNNLDSHYKVDISLDYRLVFCANHLKPPRLESGGVDWTIVSRIKILKIEKFNG